MEEVVEAAGVELRKRSPAAGSGYFPSWFGEMGGSGVGNRDGEEEWKATAVYHFGSKKKSEVMLLVLYESCAKAAYFIEKDLFLGR